MGQLYSTLMGLVGTMLTLTTFCYSLDDPLFLEKVQKKARHTCVLYTLQIFKQTDVCFSSLPYE